MSEEVRAYNPEETRRRLLEAGLRLFGVAGRESVSTRALAEAAGVALNAIQYHFGGKDQVYLAIAREIATTTGAQIRSAAEAVLAEADASPDQAAEAAGRLLARVVATVLAAPDAAARGGFILREQLQPTAAFDVLHEGFVETLHVALTRLTARATGTSPADPTTVMRAHALLGQALVFGMARQTLARRLGRDALDESDFGRAMDTVAELARLALAGAAQTTGDPP